MTKSPREIIDMAKCVRCGGLRAGSIALPATLTLEPDERLYPCKCSRSGSVVLAVDFSWSTPEEVAVPVVAIQRAEWT